LSNQLTKFLTGQRFLKKLDIPVISTIGSNLSSVVTWVSLKIPRFARNDKIRYIVTKIQSYAGALPF